MAKKDSTINLYKLLFIVILCILPFGEIIRIELLENVIIRPLDLVVGISSTIYLIQAVINKKITKSYLNKPLAIFILICVTSLFVNLKFFSFPQISVALLYLIRWISYSFVALVLLKQDRSFKQIIIKYLFTAGLLIQIIGYFQYFLYPDLRNLFYLGWDEHNYRLFSVFLDPNFAGAFFVLYLLLNIGIMHFLIKHKKYNLVKIFGFINIFTVVSIFLTYSRSAILMLIFSLFTYFVLINKKKYIILLIFGTAFVITLLIPTFNKENTNLLRITSSLARVQSYKNSIEIIRKHPVFGVGFNTYRYAQQKYGFKQEYYKYNNHADAGVDSSLLFVFATTGILGIFAYIFLWYVVIRRMIFLKHKKNTILPNIVIAATAGLFINSFFINSLFYVPIMLWMWMLIALAEDY